MKELIGSAKQVAWAEDIRAGKTRAAEVLREAVAVLNDFSQVSEPDQDLFGSPLSTTHLVYAVELRPEHKTWFSAARPWWPGTTEDRFQDITFTTQRGKEYAAAGEEHADRKATRDLYAETLAALEIALAEQAEAKYWIDRR